MKSLIALFPTVLFVMPVQGNAQSSVPDTPAAREARETAPQLFAYTRDVLFGDLWKRPELVPRDRSLVTLSALLANGQAAQMTSHINLALDNGLKPGEIVALITQLAFYSGWPNAMSAVGVAKDVFAQRGIQPDRLPRESTKLLPVDEAAEAQRAAIVKENIAPMAHDLARYTDEVLFANLWRQPDLAARDRSLVTTAALIARGQLDQLPYYLSRAKEDGVTKTQAAEVATQLAFYAGWPRAMSALPIIKTVYAERN